MQKVMLGEHGELLVPKKIIKNLELFVDQPFSVHQEGNKIIFEPTLLLHEHIMKAVEQGKRDIKNGKFIEFSSIEEFDEKMKLYKS